MTIRFHEGSFEGEVSALPEQFVRLPSDSTVHGVWFGDFTYASGGSSTYRIIGAQIGVSFVPPGSSLTLQGERQQSVGGDAFHLRGPGHVQCACWNDRLSGRVLSLAPSALERMFHQPLSKIRINGLTCDLSERPAVHHLLTALVAESMKCGAHPDPIVVESVALAVTRSSGIVANEPAARRAPTLSVQQASRLRDIIAAQLTEPIGLKDLAATVGFSESYLVRSFKGSFGVTPYQYILRERVVRAQSLIRAGNLSMSEVAALSGFGNQARMRRTFRQVTGRSPTGRANATPKT